MTIYTEREAWDRWCPFARVAENLSNVPFAFNRVQNIAGDQITAPPGAKCIGSQCMAWRWDRNDETPDGHARGYCGAFGKVEP